MPPQLGAKQNSRHQAKDGLPADFFPEKLPIYTGHYHIPHVVGGRGSNIRYVGSPYQGAFVSAGCNPLRVHASRQGQRQCMRGAWRPRHCPSMHNLSL